MGWRTDDAYERTREAETRALVAALSPRDKFRLRLWQAKRLAIPGLVLAIVIVAVVQHVWG